MSKKKKPINKQIKKLFNDIPYEEPTTEPRKEDPDLSKQAEPQVSEADAGDLESGISESEQQVVDEPELHGEEKETGQEGSPESENVEAEMGEADPQAAASLDSHEGEGETGQGEAPEGEPEVDLSPEELLEDVRHSLITDSAVKSEAEKSKWWKRIFKGKPKTTEPEEPPKVEIPALSAEPIQAAADEVTEQDGYVEQLDELIDMLEEDAGKETSVENLPVAGSETAVPEVEPEPEVVDIEELKKRVYSARPASADEEISLSEVRSVALDDGEEVFVEVESRAEDPMKDRMKGIENALRPFRRYLYFIFIFVSLVMVVLVSVSLYRVWQQSLPPPQVEEVVQLPYPVGMNLPGGLYFSLGKGSLKDGRWDPSGPEWLEGTEICRWIAIPYSRQLEAVVRTLSRDDQIELIMSNNDRLSYSVSSINQLTLEDMEKLSSDTPCMLLVLAQSGTDERWVVNAVP